MCFFKKSKKNQEKNNKTSFYDSKGFSLSIALFLKNSDDIDLIEINDMIKDYFENYFKNRDVGYKYKGVTITMNTCSLYGEVCKIQIILDEGVEEFVSNYDLEEWKLKLFELSGTQINSFVNEYISKAEIDAIMDEKMRELYPNYKRKEVK